jgi:hypothetical protein
MRTTGFPVRRIAAAAWLLVLALAVAGCAAIGAALQTSSALQGAGYQDVSVNVATGSGSPAGWLVSVSYSSGPAGNDQSDAQRAEKIVWDTFPGRFESLAIIKESGGCAGPICATHSNEVASATYAQLAARFGPRPHGLDKASATAAVPGWAVGLGIGRPPATGGAGPIGGISASSEDHGPGSAAPSPVEEGNGAARASSPSRALPAADGDLPDRVRASPGRWANGYPGSAYCNSAYCNRGYCNSGLRNWPV